ncbi:ATP synthase F1 subunit delta [Mucilaginibacter arboris]|uniref:ATP synthase subunit delta n=1 Tax=Mucilaginibacter arboris TaxID=2682090 RepID=A0A7K1SSM4_9SPHI|nr:ATP synthase F1 subunit delta [Mucilaginibacter arboris]MVN20312.1 ATP synthase F1 subunit delta [Mucilaginibacter arboris]
MSEFKVATRYAKSLIDLAEEQNLLEEIKTDMALFVQALKSNSTLNAVLRNPIVSPLKKVAILVAIFSGKVQPATLEFFKIMVNKMRSEILFETAKEFVEQYNLKKNIVKAVIVSAVPLSESNRNEAMEVVRKATAGEVLLEEKIDPKLIGGFILTVGDRQFDTSISSTLSKLKKDFDQKSVTELVK